MAEHSNIQFTHRTFSPWIGCTEISTGCANCYAARSTPAKAFGVTWGKGQPRRRSIDWSPPRRWNARPWICLKCGTGTSNAPGSGKSCPKCGGIQTERTRLFFSLGDPFDEEVPLDMFTDFLALLWETPELDWYLFTKRPHRALIRLRDAHRYAVASGTRNAGFVAWLAEWESGGSAPINVWMIASAENQSAYNSRLNPLLRVPAVVHGISVEPMLGPIRLEAMERARDLDWIVVGGESHDNQPDARPCEVAWIEDLIVQASELRIPIFVKQMGTNPLVRWDRAADWRCSSSMQGDLRRLNLKHRKGGDPMEWPEHFRLLNTPKSQPRGAGVLP